MGRKKAKRITGILSKHRRGFGFVVPEGKGELTGDIFISPKDIGSAMDQDKVSVRISSSGSQNCRSEGVIEKVIERAGKEVVGTFVSKQEYGYIIPVRSRGSEEVIVPKKGFKGAKSGDMVAADIIRWPAKDYKAEAVIKEILSRKGEAGGDVKGLIRAFRVREVFPSKVKAFASSISQSLEAEDIKGRRDLTEKLIITIDGEDAKDLDDAVSAEKLSNGNYLLSVHIADVSHYVKEGVPVDAEALKRGTSIYLIDWVVPMLPAELSNGICSLAPGKERLALSVAMEIDGSGSVVSYEIFESLIRSVERMTYTDVSDILEKNDKVLIKKYSLIYTQLVVMKELADILRDSRRSRGSLDFDIGEAQISLNDKGVPIRIEIAERRIANRIIEEFMLVTNKTVAEHCYNLQLPFIYRVHEKPSSERIEEFKKFLLSLGIKLKGNTENLHPKVLNEVLDTVRGSDEEHVVNTVMLRSMKKAYYNIECLGHFGLGMNYYCHFTAPIRRYPDLINHRIIKEDLNKKIYSDRIDFLGQKSLEAAENSSLMERKAEELEREVERLKKAEFMSYHIGESYSGIISGITSYGFYVQIENTIEGLVRITALDDDYYIYEEEKYRFIGENSRKVFSLGSPIEITVESVNMETREISFILNDQGSRRRA